MILPVSQVQNVLRTYGKQLNIARLNSQEKRPVRQVQEDRIEISEEARQMLAQKKKEGVDTIPATSREPLNQPTETPALNEISDDDFDF